MFVVRFTGEDFPPFEKITSGLAPNYYYLSKYLSKHDVDTTLITGGYPKYKKYEDFGYFDVIRIRTYPKFSKDFFFANMNIRAMREIKRIKNIGLLQFHNFFGVWIQKFRKKLNLPEIVLTVHGSDPFWCRNAEFVPGLLGFFDKIENERCKILHQLACENTDNIVCVSQAVADEVLYYYQVENDKVHVIYNGVETDFFYPRKTNELREKHDAEFLMLHIGSLAPRKGLKYLFKAMSTVNRDVKLILVGEDKRYRPYAEWLINNYGIKDKVVFAGKVPMEELPSYYSSADCYVLPTLAEGLPKVLLESLACECPVITTTASGNPELVKHKVNGLLLAPRNANAFAEAIEYAIENRRDMKNMGREGRKLVVENFTWEKAAKKYAELYRKIAG